ncbi:MAG: M1 family metallopeptidase [Polyangiaceae bacterium]|nr:M1 family metallopeptidase [Polyangiaceae bacterium]
MRSFALVRRLSLGLFASTLLVACPGARTSDVPEPTTSTASAPPSSDEPTLAGRLPTTVAPISYSLELRVDPTKETFTGRSTIAIRTKSAEKRLFLHGHDIRVTAASISSPSGTKQTVKVTALPDKSLLRLDWTGELPAGEHTVELEYEAPFGKELSGLYRVERDGQSYAFTQFEALDARRAFPCFDEPSFKTPFDVTLVVPKGQVAVSNTRQIERTESSAGDRVRFATTEKLPTYLVAFAVGPFDVVDAPPIPATKARPKATPLRGIAVKGKGKHLKEALAEHTKLVVELESYFGIAYPYDKLDVIAVPDFAAGAMENAGAITYREALVLVDPASATEQQRRDVAGVAAHELAHQWFGNLVTMAWWDDLWLNEAFATWMGQRVIQSLYPAWNADLELTEWAHGAMETDSLVSARKIRQTIVDDGDVENAFDDLTYSKGAGILAMFERFVGAEAFQAGIRRYLDEHRFGSATTEQFLTSVFGADGETKTSAAFRQFLERAGVPRVSIDAPCENGKLARLEVAAERYLPLGSKGEAASTWALPLCVKTGDATTCDLVSATATKKAVISLTKPVACPTFIFPNADGAGYIRYTPNAAQSKELFGKAYSKLSPRERLAAVDALRASFRAGAVDASTLLDILPTIAKDKVRNIAASPAGLLAYLSTHVVEDKDRASFTKIATELYQPTFKRLGWAAKAGAKEDAESKLARKDAITGLLTIAREPALRKEAVTKARAWLGVGGPENTAALSPDLLEPVLTVAAQDGGPEVFDAIVARLKKSEDAVVRRSLLIAISSASDPKLAERARALSLDEAVFSGERIRYVIGLFNVPETREAAWAWLSKNLPAVVDAVPEGVRSYLPLLVEALCDADREAEVRKVFAPQLKNMQGADHTLENAIEKMRICHAIRKHHMSGLSDALKKR